MKQQVLKDEGIGVYISSSGNGFGDGFIYPILNHPADNGKYYVQYDENHAMPSPKDRVVLFTSLKEWSIL